MNHLSATIISHIKRLSESQSDPIAAFIYDLAELKHHAQKIMSCLPSGCELYYAMKANSESEILDVLAPIVDGFEISSGGEIQKVLNCFQNKNFIFSGPGKLKSDLRHALKNNVEFIHVESFSEIKNLNQVAAELNIKQRVLIRINPILPDYLLTKLSMAGTATPFGIEESQLETAVALVDECENLTLSGFHIHAMSHQTQVLHLKKLLDWYLEKWSSWRTLSGNVEDICYLNVGGGMGVEYVGSEQFDWPELCRHLDGKLKEHAKPPTIRFEPGRFVTAFCGYYAMEVLDIKLCHDKTFAVCRGGTHHFRLPVAQSHDHPILHVPMNRNIDDNANVNKLREITIVGQLCTPKDILCRDIVLPDLRIGDILVLPLAGAYGYNISHINFLCHPQPSQVFIN